MPYPNELIYSTIARAGLYQGLISPKQLLDTVFNDRKVTATLDLPSHLHKISHHLAATGRYSVDELIYKHTLFPIYAPFVTEDKRQRAIQMMGTVSQGAVHLMLGVAASRIQKNNHFRYCPKCMEQQQQKYGECFWQRNWYFPGLNTCAQHGELVFLNNRFKDHRHQFSPFQYQINNHAQNNHVTGLNRIAQTADQLLTIPISTSPTPNQWSTFYKEIANDLGYCRGNHIIFERINGKILSHFPTATLQQLNLAYSTNSETHWLKSIFRKHRKSFSYIEHAIIWNALLPSQQPGDIIAYVKSLKSKKIISQNSNENSPLHVEALCTQQRNFWITLVKQYGITEGRKQSKGIYAWLYKNDTTWLLHFNAQHKQPHINNINRVNWYQRDIKVTRQLLKIIYNIDLYKYHPRISANWLLKQIPNPDAIHKNLDKLPILQKLLHRHTESITEYQLRRLCIAYSDSLATKQNLASWAIFRRSGLSKERLTKESLLVLKMLNIFEEEAYEN